jgi:hypothetical protein
MRSPRAEVALIDLDFAAREGRGALALFGDAPSAFKKDRGDALARQHGQLSRPAGGQAEGEVAQHLQEFTLADFGAPVILV